MSLQLHIDYLNVVKTHFFVDGFVKTRYDISFLSEDMKRLLQISIVDYITELLLLQISSNRENKQLSYETDESINLVLVITKTIDL